MVPRYPNLARPPRHIWEYMEEEQEVKFDWFMSSEDNIRKKVVSILKVREFRLGCISIRGIRDKARIEGAVTVVQSLWPLSEQHHRFDNICKLSVNSICHLFGQECPKLVYGADHLSTATCVQTANLRIENS
jgi:hypothetical protein